MSPRSGPLVAVVACVLALGLLAVGPVGPVDTAGGAQTLIVSNVTVSPDTPTPGDTVTVHATVENPATNGRSFELMAVALRNEGGDGLPEYDRARDVGTLGPGSKITVPLRRTFDSSGTYSMRVVAYPSGPRSSVKRPVQVRVGPETADEPKVDLAVDDLTAGTESELNLTVANSLQNDVLGTEITLNSDGLDVVDDHRVFAEIERGSKESVGYRVTPTRSGTVDAEATITYATDEGSQTARKSFELNVAAAEPDLALDARSRTENGSTVIAATITNAGNAPVRDLRLGTPSSNVSLTPALVETVAAGEQRTVDVEVDAVEGSGTRTVPLVASYAVAGERLTTETAVDVTTNPGSIRLTGLRVERQGATVHVSGSTSNVGLSDADAVLVEVLDTANVTPAGPNRDYFVGAVPANEFVTFDVYARPTGATSTVPVRVEYIVNGVRDSHVVEVPLGSSGPTGSNAASGPDAGSGPDAPNGPNAGGDGPGSGPASGFGLGPLAFGAVVVGAIAGVMLRGWRRSRGGD